MRMSGQTSSGTDAGSVPIGDRIMKERPTIHDVAREAGVSAATVSRLINGTARVSSKTSHAIQEAMEKLDYVPSYLAQTFKRGSSRTIAFVIDDKALPLQPNIFTMTVLVGLNDVLSSEGYSIQIQHGVRKVSTAGGGKDTWLLDAWQRQEFAGVVMTNPTRNDPRIEMVREGKIPAVVIGRHPDAGEIAQVDIDNVGGTRAATEHLIRVGRGGIAYLGPEVLATAVDDRRRGYSEAMLSSGESSDGLRWIATEGDGLEAFSFESAARAVYRATVTRPTWNGLVAFNDEMALGAIRALEARGYQVPSDVAVVGFDDMPFARMTRPSLTTIHQNMRQLGQHTARALLAALQGQVFANLTIQTVALVIRASSGAGLTDDMPVGILNLSNAGSEVL